MFKELQKINARPKPFEFYTAEDLWTDEHTSEQMLKYHLNEDVDLSSRRAEFIDRSVEWIASRFTVGPETKIADFGCGPGLYTTRLARRQAQVTGVDFSQRSIRYARDTALSEGLTINYVHQNYLDYTADERFDLVMMIFCDFCALNPEQRTTLLKLFFEVLKPGGSVLLDVHLLNAFDRREEAALYEKNQLDGFWSAGDYYGFLNTFKYETEKVVLDKYTIIEAGRTRTVYNWLQYFSPESLQKELTDCGFVVDGMYGDVAGSPFDPLADECAVVASKP